MKNNWFLALVSFFGGIALSVLAWWAAWWPLRNWVFSVLPNNEWNGVLKIVSVLGIFFTVGGGFPFLFFAVGTVMASKALES